jgi:multicomponent K+:H+ antiporter subunit G
MSEFAEIPLWAALLIAFFLILGSGLTLLGTIGLLRFETFYQRIHAPTLGTTWGAGGILIALFITVTTPVTLMLLARATLYRDRSENSGDVPELDPVPPPQN